MLAKLSNGSLRVFDVSHDGEIFRKLSKCKERKLFRRTPSVIDFVSVIRHFEQIKKNEEKEERNDVYQKRLKEIARLL